MDINLKPCPFCGGEAEMLSDDEHVWVRCKDCFVELYPFAKNVNYCAKEKAAELWNTRVHEEPAEELADPLGFLKTN